jgi:hypothetical protein
MAVRNKWIWGASGTRKYAVSNLIEIEIVKNLTDLVQVVARTRVGYQRILLKLCDSELEAQKFINETFPSK